MQLSKPITVRMVLNQVRLLARSFILIIRRPSRGRHVLPMIRSLRSDPLQLGVPWLPFEVTDMLERHAAGKGAQRVFEFGGGGSTIWFSERYDSVVSVEHDKRWYDRLAKRTSSQCNVTLLYRSLEDMENGYVAAIADYPDCFFDVVLVDGRRRSASLRAALAKVAPGGYLVVDDSDRARYEQVLTEVPWPRVDIAGFAPCKPTLGYTTVFTKPRPSQ